MNTILGPLVEELTFLEKGVNITQMICRGKLLIVCADLPAARKILGLNAVTAHKGEILKLLKGYTIEPIQSLMNWQQAAAAAHE